MMDLYIIDKYYVYIVKILMLNWSRLVPVYSASEWRGRGWRGISYSTHKLADKITINNN